MTPILTEAGKNLLLKALAGETLTFTKMQIGNGAAQDPLQAIALQNPLVTVSFSSVTTENGYVTLQASFNNSQITAGFRITEAGFFVTDPADNTKEILYAIGFENEGVADYVPDNTNRILEMQFRALIFIGDAQNISAAINNSLVYTTKESFDAHCNNSNNPHGVTKAQVGLGNVPNVATNDQEPTYDDISALDPLSSGEKLSAAFSKIKRAVSSLILHIANTGNPHSVTANQVGAAPTSHQHGTADINAGVLGVLRGGTGRSALSAFIVDLMAGGVAKTDMGTYTGTGSYGQLNKNTIDFSSPPKVLLVMPADNPTNAQNGGFVVLKNVTSIRSGGLMSETDNSESQLHFSWVDNSVSWYSANSAYRQQNYSGKTYIYLAIL